MARIFPGSAVVSWERRRPRLLAWSVGSPGAQFPPWERRRPRLLAWSRRLGCACDLAIYILAGKTDVPAFARALTAITSRRGRLRSQAIDL